MRLGQFRPVTCGESMELCLFSILFNEEGSQRAFRCRAVVDGKELAWAEGVCMADVYHLWQRPNNLTSKNHARTSTAVAEFRQNGSTKAWRLLFALPARGLIEASPNPLSAPRWCDRVVASRPDEKLVSGNSPDRSIALCGPSNNSNACTCTCGLSDRTAKTR